MSNVKNAKNLNNIDNAVMHKLDNEDREKIDSILVQLDVLDEFNKIMLCPHPSCGIVDLYRSGLLQLILPELVS